MPAESGRFAHGPIRREQVLSIRERCEREELLGLVLSFRVLLKLRHDSKTANPFVRHACLLEVLPPITQRARFSREGLVGSGQAAGYRLIARVDTLRRSRIPHSPLRTGLRAGAAVRRHL